ncbi:MAG: hypothetical protein EOP47_00890 [Sphingobacteriaceae bacterium]|nr:MAG: hypothetical protein EOP47_00890 [Sphingobacteriaceae bacterium]
MKRIFQILIPVLAIALLISSCGAPAALTGASRARFVGTWTLNTVTYQGLVAGSVSTVFDQAAPSAFVGSTWQLTNSGNGMYTLNNGTSQTIFWSLYKDEAAGTMFQFKKIYQGDAPKNVPDGYRLMINDNDGQSMTLKSPVTMGNTTGYVVYSFTKNK